VGETEKRRKPKIEQVMDLAHSLAFSEPDCNLHGCLELAMYIQL
jgi:hypothetical protein